MHDTVTTEEAAAICRTTRQTIYNWIKSGRIRAVRSGPRKLLVRREDLPTYEADDADVYEAVTVALAAAVASGNLELITDVHAAFEALRSVPVRVASARHHAAVATCTDPGIGMPLLVALNNLAP